jgi:hypothetical protein
LSRSSIRYIDTTYLYGQEVNVAPVSNPVIYGRFPQYTQNKSPIEKVNKIMSCLLLMLVIVSLVSYYFVTDGEKSMNLLGREIVALTNENIELQSKIDNLHSFNKVDEIIHNKNFLDTAKKVLEVPAVNLATMPKITTAPVSYGWTIGY